jgi:hypothetical protein
MIQTNTNTGCRLDCIMYLHMGDMGKFKKKHIRNRQTRAETIRADTSWLSWLTKSTIKSGDQQALKKRGITEKPYE